jgi:hypothetical protein
MNYFYIHLTLFVFLWVLVSCVADHVRSAVPVGCVYPSRVRVILDPFHWRGSARGAGCADRSQGVGPSDAAVPFPRQNSANVGFSVTSQPPKLPPRIRIAEFGRRHFSSAVFLIPHFAVHSFVYFPLSRAFSDRTAPKQAQWRPKRLPCRLATPSWPVSAFRANPERSTGTSDS